MELVAGDCPKRDFAGDVDPFNGSDGGCDWVYDSRQSRNDDALATLADLASPPQKLKPIRCGGAKVSSEDRHPLDILAGTLDRLPEMGFLGDGCFASKIADLEVSGQLAAKDDHGMEFQGPVSANRTSLDGVSLSSSVDSDSHYFSPGLPKTVTGKRKRETKDHMEHFVEKLVGKMMKRQEKMHDQLIRVMEKMEHQRICREEAWRQQEMERMKQNEEARKQEMSRSLSLISLIKTVVGEEIEIPALPSLPPQTLPKQCEDRNWVSAQTRQRDINLVHSSGRRWPPEEVQVLINCRSEVGEKTGVHKGAIWDEVSAKMRVRGYDRSAKKCKEKWENMNKYYRRVLEGKRKQPEHSKTQSYFHKLGDFYKTNSAEKEEPVED